MAEPKLIVVVTANVTEMFGGEAIKAFQFVRYLHKQGHAFILVTHDRREKEIREKLKDINVKFVKDGFVQFAFWKSRIFSFLLTPIFHLKARQIIKEIAAEEPSLIVHYLCPISPVEPRFPLNGISYILGPLSGATYHPRGFRNRESVATRLKQYFYNVIMHISGHVFRDKKNAKSVLVSGGNRTRDLLRLAGCHDSKMLDVVDSGVSQYISQRPRIQHDGELHRFVCSSRLINLKGIDLAIRALSKTSTPAVLDIIGKGPEELRLRQLTERLGLTDRVCFLGWMTPHETLLDRLTEYRAFVFPSLAESNGIAMQEAMMIGLPVITLRWGGPSMLANDDSAMFIEPLGPEHVITQIAKSMEAVGTDSDYANKLAENARKIADKRFTWESAAKEWMQPYGEL